MLTPDLLHDYQKKAVNFQCTRQQSMLWLDMGLGKTVITLTSMAHLLQSGYLKGVIIVAPIRVVRLVWRQEAAKWNHTKDLTFSVVAGTKDQRTRALLRKADVYLINYENLRWLSEMLRVYFVNKGKSLPFDGIVWDEISKMKNSSTARVKATRKILPAFKWSTGLTGTPASNGYKDLHGQYLVVDQGERLGTSKTAFRSRFYYKQGPYKEVPYPDTETAIKNLISDITLEMSAEDYNPLPDLMINNIEVELPDRIRAQYDSLEKDLFFRLDNGDEVEVFNQASLTNKALQFSNGAVYPIPGLPIWEKVHDLKLEALEDILDEAGGSPVLCAYSYRSDAERIMERFKDIHPINLTECKSEKSLVDAMSRWASGDCRLMIGHPACLHPETQVLTERHGWIRIIDVDVGDRVFDGVEFVSHDGCSFSGVKEVMNIFGITMTPDHNLLIDDEWTQAQNVKDIENARVKALYEYKGDDPRLSGMFAVRGNLGNSQTECGQAQSHEEGVLSALHRGYVPSTHRHPDMADMVGHEASGKRCVRPQLRGSWDWYVRPLGHVCEFLRGHARRLLGRSDNRAHRCEQTILQRELQMGDQYGAAGQQAEHQAPKTSPVYDLVNCGPRNRFVIRNDDGEVFISHNSMGHGIDGLQKNGHILVWYGLNWSLDLYEQFNARVRRQGQGVPVICHRILTKKTLDQAQALALDEKATTQSGLRKAIKDYRQSKGM